MKFDKLISFTALGVLFIFSIFYFKERIIFLDSAYYAFQLINTETFFNSGRFFTAIPQILPLILVKLNTPLPIVLASFSGSFVLINIILYLAIRFYLKDVESGILLILIQFIAIKAFFFLPVSEVHLSLSFAVLFYAWINADFVDKIKFLIYFLITLLLAYIPYSLHPISIFPMVFSFLFSIISNKRFCHLKYYTPILVIIILYSMKFLIKDLSSPYENELFGNIKSFQSNLYNLLNLFPIYQLKKHFQELYLLPFLLLVIGIIYNTFKKNFLLVLVSLLSPLIFITTIALMKPEGDAYINIEKFLYPLSFLCTLPFIYDIGKSDNKFLTIIKTLSVIIIIYIGFVKINKAGKVYSNRITYLNQMIDKSKNINSDKVILDKKNIDIKKIGPPWAVGVESILLSSLSDKTISIYISNDIRQEIIKPSDSDIYFCVPFNKRVNVNSLNNNYFKLSSSKPQKIEDSF